MSYILDALRRAESERARGQVPGLHDQPLLPAAVGPGQSWPTWAWALLALCVMLIAPLALRWAWPGAAPAPAAASVVLPAPPAVAVPAKPADPVPPLPQVVSAPLTVLPAAASSTPAGPREATAAVVRLADLPPEQRREWPNPVLGGSVWSESAANRFVIVNGQLLHEGDAAAPGLLVERIGRQALVLRWRERQVEVPL